MRDIINKATYQLLPHFVEIEIKRKPPAKLLQGATVIAKLGEIENFKTSHLDPTGRKIDYAIVSGPHGRYGCNVS